MTTRLNRAGVAGALIAASLFLGACGSSQDSSSTGSSGVGVGTPSGKVGDKLDGAEVAERFFGAMAKARSGHMTTSGSVPAEADWVIKDGKVDQVTTATVNGVAMETRMIAGMLYMKDASGAWTKTDLSAQPGSLGDPQSAKEGLKGAPATITKVDGGNTTYQVTIDVAKLTKVPGASGTATGLYTISSDGLPVSIVSKTAAGNMTITYSDLGKDVKIEVPPGM